MVAGVDVLEREGAELGEEGLVEVGGAAGWGLGGGFGGLVFGGEERDAWRVGGDVAEAIWGGGHCWRVG